MSKQLLQTRSIRNSDILQMFEHKSLLNRQRMITLEHTDASKAKVTEVIKFQSNNLIEELGYQNVIFDSLYWYYYLKAKPTLENQPQINYIFAEIMLDVVSLGKLYHIHGSTFYFKDFQLPSALSDEYREVFTRVNGGSTHVALSLSGFDGDMVLYHGKRNLDSDSIKQLEAIPRYSSLRLNDIYDYLSLNMAITATPQSIFENLTKDIL